MRGTPIFAPTMAFRRWTSSWRRGQFWGIEIKKKANPAPGKGLCAAREALRCDRSIVVHRGVDRF
jgi:hypothetical protein